MPDAARASMCGVWCVAAVATDAVNAQVVGKDENDVGLRRPRGHGRAACDAKEQEGECNCDFHHGTPVVCSRPNTLTSRNAYPAAFVKTRHRDLHVTDLPGFLELQVVDLRRGGGVCLIAQEGPVLPVGRAFDLVPIPFSIEGPADLATGKVERFFADRPATTPARPRVRHQPANRSADRRRWPGPRYVRRFQSTNCTPACSRQG